MGAVARGQGDSAGVARAVRQQQVPEAPGSQRPSAQPTQREPEPAMEPDPCVPWCAGGWLPAPPGTLLPGRSTPSTSCPSRTEGGLQKWRAGPRHGPEPPQHSRTEPGPGRWARPPAGAPTSHLPPGSLPVAPSGPLSCAHPVSSILPASSSWASQRLHLTHPSRIPDLAPPATCPHLWGLLRAGLGWGPRPCIWTLPRWRPPPLPEVPAVSGQHLGSAALGAASLPCLGGHLYHLTVSCESHSCCWWPLPAADPHPPWTLSSLCPRGESRAWALAVQRAHPRDCCRDLGGCGFDTGCHSVCHLDGQAGVAGFQGRTTGRRWQCHGYSASHGACAGL
uniref:basic proline-rich protein-like isoform X2 n=1 Tax=Ictidomys tridecemlineatus TaxID=43179 RepID=UPI001A9FDD5C|nr:basic proline-rich protein-like isoform X2 [Ictidomys tridecemlineatus]